jgi:hypothetical protein
LAIPALPRDLNQGEAFASLGEPPVETGLSPTVVPKRLLVQEERIEATSSIATALEANAGNFT